MKLKEFFEKHITIARGRKCENCGRRLSGHVSEIAHIFEKSKYKSIATEDDNILYLCGLWSDNGCHGQFDTTFEKMKNMNCFQLAIQRYLKMKHKIKEKGKKINFFENYISENLT